MARSALDAYQGQGSATGRGSHSSWFGDEGLCICACTGATPRFVIASAGNSLPILTRDVQSLQSLGSRTAEFATQSVKQGLQGMIDFPAR